MNSISSLRLPSPYRLLGLVRLKRDRNLIALAILLVSIALFGAYYFLGSARDHSHRLTHVSFDATRDFYRAANSQAASALPEPTRISMSHVGSTHQASSLSNLRTARVLSLSSTWELEQVAADWHVANRPNNPQPLPFYTTIAFVTRSDHPNPPRDWSDLFHKETTLVLPDPHQSGAGRCAILALYLAAYDGNPEAARQSLQSLLFRAKLIDATSRTALAQFALKPGDATFLTWESEGLRLASLGFPHLTSHTPPAGPLVRPAIALLDRSGETPAANARAIAYRDLHYTPEFIALAASYGFRTDSSIGVSAAFPPTQLYQIETSYPEIPELWRKLFAKDGIYDSLESLSRAYRGF